jgi:hypothetical protein
VVTERGVAMILPPLDPPPNCRCTIGPGITPPPLEAPLLIHGEQKARQYLGLTKEQFDEAQSLGFIECIDIVRRAPRFVKQHLLAQGQRYLDFLVAQKARANEKH